MHVTCEDNNGFEDALTIGKIYKAARVRYGSGSYHIMDDKGVYGWYGRGKFSITTLEGVS
jgi:hypothetical protein